MDLFPEYEEMVRLAKDVFDTKLKTDQKFRRRFWAEVAIAVSAHGRGSKLSNRGLPSNEMLTSGIVKLHPGADTEEGIIILNQLSVSRGNAVIRSSDGRNSVRVIGR